MTRPAMKAVNDTGEKENRKAKFMKKILNGDKATQTASFHKRMPTLLKKAHELQILCDVLVCIVCFGRNGNVYVWPDHHPHLKNLILWYRGIDDNLKKESTYLDLLHGKKKKLEDKVIKEKINRLILSLCKTLDGLSGTCLMDFLNELQEKVENFKKKIDILIREEKGKPIQVANQETSADYWLANIDDWLCNNTTATCSENPWMEFEVINDFPHGFSQPNAIPDEKLGMKKRIIPTDQM